MSSSTRPPSQRPSTQQRPATQQRLTSQRPATQQRATSQRPATRAGTGAASVWSRPVVLIGCAAAAVILAGLVALLRPTAHAPVENAGDATTEAPVEAALEIQAAPEPDLDAAASRPHAGSAVALLVQADEAYESRDFKAARDLYLDLLLTGCDFGGDEGEAVSRWAHGRLALATARLARTPGTRLLDEPVFRFREGPR